MFLYHYILYQERRLYRLSWTLQDFRLGFGITEQRCSQETRDVMTLHRKHGDFKMISEFRNTVEAVPWHSPSLIAKRM